MADVAGSSRLIIAGQPETTEDLERLTGLIHELELERRVEVIPRWISEEEKIRLMANARGVVYLPFGEDSYGYVRSRPFTLARQLSPSRTPEASWSWCAIDTTALCLAM